MKHLIIIFLIIFCSNFLYAQTTSFKVIEIAQQERPYGDDTNYKNIDDGTTFVTIQQGEPFTITLKGLTQTKLVIDEWVDNGAIYDKELGHIAETFDGWAKLPNGSDRYVEIVIYKTTKNAELIVSTNKTKTKYSLVLNK
jgi:hypothetical protein